MFYAVNTSVGRLYDMKWSKCSMTSEFVNPAHIQHSVCHQLQCIQCHYGHLLDFAVALAFYQFVWPLTFPHAKTLDFSVGGWISIVVAFNLAVEWTLFPFWHWMTYSTASLASKLRGYKYNQLNQYEGPDRWDTLRRYVR